MGPREGRDNRSSHWAGLGWLALGQGLPLELAVHFQMEHSQAGHGVWASSLLFWASVSPCVQASVG